MNGVQNSTKWKIVQQYRAVEPSKTMIYCLEESGLMAWMATCASASPTTSARLSLSLSVSDVLFLSSDGPRRLEGGRVVVVMVVASAAVVAMA